MSSKTSFFGSVCRLPLSAVLGLQVLVVAAAFIAVILVLSEQQRKEFKDSLYTQLELRQVFVLQSITAPLIQRMEAFDSAIIHYTNGQDGNNEFAAPSDDPSDNTLEKALPFFNHFYIISARDPGIKIVAIVNQSGRPYKPYENRSRTVVWNIYAFNPTSVLAIEREVASVCLGVYPIKNVTTSCRGAGNIRTPYNSAAAMRAPVEYTRSLRVWGAGFLLADPLGYFNHVITYTRNMGQNYLGNPHMLVFTISMGIDHIVPLMNSLSAQPTSRSAVFTHFIRLEYNTTDYFLIAAKKDFPDFDPVRMLATGNNSQESAWRGGHTPDPVLNAVFLQSEHKFPESTATEVFELEVGDDKYVASAARLYMPDADINWLLLEYTPREDFFGASDRARVTGIVIGAMGGLVVLVVCILIWVAIQVPLRKLGASMGLAADMRNDEVVHSDPVLSEIGALNDAFRQMNNKLLAARPFLPQSLLRASNTTDEEEDEEEEDMDFVTSPTRRRVGAHDEDDSSKIPSDYVSVLSELHKGSNTHDMNASSRGAMMKTTDGSISFRSSSVPLARQSRLRDFAFRRVSVLSINVIGFSELLSGNASDKVAGPSGTMTHLARVHTALTKLIETAVGEERGIVDYFHGDRFVCGFNTARVCGNAARNGAECAAKIWDRFLAHGNTNAKNNNELLQAFPHGLAMGLGVGRAAVGNHGTDTMQRLGTIGGPYSEAMRLMDVMSRRVLMGCGGQRGGVSSSSPSAGVPQPNPLVVGRCLVMGRVIQELETSKVYCQIVGGVEARELLTSSASMNEASIAAFVRGKNSRALKLGTVSPTVQHLVDGRAPRDFSQSPLTKCVSPPTHSPRRGRPDISSPLKNVMVVSSVPKSPFSSLHTSPWPKEDASPAPPVCCCHCQQKQRKGSNLSVHHISASASSVLVATVVSQTSVRQSSQRSTFDRVALTSANRAQFEHISSQSNHSKSNNTTNAINNPYNNLSFIARKSQNGVQNNPVVTLANRQLQEEASLHDEWLYELEEQQSQNPFTAANVAIARLWNEGFVTLNNLVPPSYENTTLAKHHTMISGLRRQSVVGNNTTEQQNNNVSVALSHVFSFTEPCRQLDKEASGGGIHGLGLVERAYSRNNNNIVSDNNNNNNNSNNNTHSHNNGRHGVAADSYATPLPNVPLDLGLGAPRGGAEDGGTTSNIQLETSTLLSTSEQKLFQLQRQEVVSLPVLSPLREDHVFGGARGSGREATVGPPPTEEDKKEFTLYKNEDTMQIKKAALLHLDSTSRDRENDQPVRATSISELRSPASILVRSRNENNIPDLSTPEQLRGPCDSPSNPQNQTKNRRINSKSQQSVAFPQLSGEPVDYTMLALEPIKAVTSPTAVVEAGLTSGNEDSETTRRAQELQRQHHRPSLSVSYPLDNTKSVTAARQDAEGDIHAHPSVSTTNLFPRIQQWLLLVRDVLQRSVEQPEEAIRTFLFF